MARVIAFDTETGLIRPALLAPPLVCITWQERGLSAAIEHHRKAKAHVEKWLRSGAIIVGHNVAYDMAVLCQRFPDLIPLIFEAYNADRVTDTMLRQQLLDIAGGVYRRSVGAKGKRIAQKYDLATLAWRAAGMRLEKDEWRLSYDKFLDTPMEGWTARAREVQAEARERLAALIPSKDNEKEVEGLRSMVASSPEQCKAYPLDDARATLTIYEAQQKHAAYLHDQYRQARAYFWLYLSSAWGLKTDEYGVEILRRETKAQLEEVEIALKQAGLVKLNGVRDTKAAKARMIMICEREGMDIPRTDAHCADDAKCKGADDCKKHVCLDADACNETEDELLMMYAELSTLKKVLSNDIEALAKGILYPVHTRYGLAETGRTTSSKPNIQNVCKRPGIREAFIPRPGKVFAQADFPQLELYALAQCCVTWFGFSKLADALNAGMDPHLWVAAFMMKITYDEANAAYADKAHPRHEEAVIARQLAKPANFGFPGGLGADTFILFVRAQTKPELFAKFDLTVGRVKELKANWLEAWPEMVHYFARVNALCAANDNNRATVETLFTKRTRGNATYCAANNNGFQALGSDIAKNAGWLIATAQYADEESSLFGARTVAFVHDEFIAEVDDNELAHFAAYEMAVLMAKGANVYLPDVPIPLTRIKPLLMRRWSKKAEQVFVDGRLIPWAA